MKRKKLLLNSKVATLTQKSMPSYLSRVFATILIKMSTFKNYGLTSFQKPWLWCILFFFKVCPWIQLPFFMLSFFIMFLEVKKIFPLNLVAGPCDSLNFDKILWHSIDICFILFLSVFFLQAKRGNSSSVSIISRRTASIGESWFPYQRWKGYLGMLPIPWRSFREILPVMFYMKSKSWMLYFFRSSSNLYMYIC